MSKKLIEANKFLSFLITKNKVNINFKIAFLHTNNEQIEMIFKRKTSFKSSSNMIKSSEVHLRKLFSREDGNSRLISKPLSLPRKKRMMKISPW